MVGWRHGRKRISKQTMYQWRKRFGKLESADVKRLRHLERENAKLKKLALRCVSGRTTSCSTPARTGSNCTVIDEYARDETRRH